MAFAPSFPVRSLDDVRRLEAVPLEEAIGVQSTYELFVASAGAFGDKPALRFLESADPDDETIVWTYAELLANIRGTANMLHGLGVGPGDAVSILMPACLEYHLALWGGEAAGIVNPLNPLLAEDKLVELMLASKTKVLIAWRDETEGNYWQKALAAAAQVEGLEAVLRVGPRPPGGTLPKDFAKDVFGFQELLAAQPDDRLVSGRRILPGDTAAYFHTGGTTGSPKLAMHTHGNQVFTAWASVKMLGISDQDRTINGYPLFHVAGVLPGALATLSAGAEMLIPTTRLMRNPDIIRNYWKLVDRHKTTVVSGVPTVLAALAQVPLDGADISSVAYCRTGAAPLPPELGERFEDLFGLHVHESLGMTETAGITSITPPGVVAPAGCVGFPVPFCRVRIASVDASGAPAAEDMPPGQVGLVLVRAPNVFPGYLDCEATRSSFTEDGWLITGDLGFLDAEGRVNLTGRAKDLIIRSGHNIDPKMIEDVLDAHPAVDLCAAVGAPDPYAGELPVAFVTLKAGADAGADELLEFASGRVDERPARPKSVTVLEAMPQTNVGKIFKPELRRMASEAAVRAGAGSLIDAHGDLRLLGVSASLDKAGRISVDLRLEGDREALRQITSELRKYPVPVTVSA